jgi:hypothetical protein
MSWALVQAEPVAWKIERTFVLVAVYQWHDYFHKSQTDSDL